MQQIGVQPGSGPERRAYPRYRVDCPATITPVLGASRMTGRLLELSLGGCRVETDQRYLANIMVRMEVEFNMRGIPFRLVGVTVGTRSKTSFAVRFLDMSERRREQLAELLAEIAQEADAK